MSATGRGALAQPATADREIVISRVISAPRELVFEAFTEVRHLSRWWGPEGFRSEEHTSELQSHSDLVCRLLLEKKNSGLGPSSVVSPERAYAQGAAGRRSCLAAAGLPVAG